MFPSAVMPKMPGVEENMPPARGRICARKKRGNRAITANGVLPSAVSKAPGEETLPSIGTSQKRGEIGAGALTAKGVLPSAAVSVSKTGEEKLPT